MIRCIDHRDSFCWNLIAQLRGQGYPLEVCQSADIDSATIEQLLEGVDALVLSPGPGHPRDYPNSLALYRAAKDKIPIIGICLGFQIMLEAEDKKVTRLPEILHGVQTPIRTDPTALAYRGVRPMPLVGRYHSLGLADLTLPDGWHASGWDATSGRMLSFENPALRLFGFQYHPDSFLTPDGERILANVLSASLPHTSPAQSPSVNTGDLWGQHGAFSTLRLSIRNEARAKTGTLWFPSAHSQRLQADLAALALAPPERLALQSAFMQATQAHAQDLEAGEWLVRWSSAPPRSAIAVRPCNVSQPTLVGHCSPFQRLHPKQKSLYYADLIELMKTVDRSTTEILLIDPQRQLLLEGITGNLLLFRDGACFTPADNCLPGLTLRMLEKQLSPTLKIHRTPIPLADLQSFDAIAICGTGRGVLPIQSIPQYNWQQRDSIIVPTLQHTWQSIIQSTDDRIDFPINY